MLYELLHLCDVKRTHTHTPSLTLTRALHFCLSRGEVGPGECAVKIRGTLGGARGGASRNK